MARYVYRHQRAAYLASKPRDGDADGVAEPVVVGLLWASFSLVDRSIAALDSDEVFGGDLLGEHALLVEVIVADGCCELRAVDVSVLPGRTYLPARTLQRKIRFRE